MPTSYARIPTASGSKYLQQLCKHWGHKFAVDFTPERGMIPFHESRVCRLKADAAGLELEVEAGDEETLVHTQQVVFNHLKRFAFREELPEPTWTRAN